MKTKDNLRISEWITPQGKNYSYQIYWPCIDNLNPEKSIVDVYVKLKEDPKRYVGTFLTMKELEGWFDRFNQNGEYANGVYIPLPKNILVKRISHRIIEKTIEDLLKEKKVLPIVREDLGIERLSQEFFRYFEEIDE